MAEPIEMPFGIWTLMVPRNRELDRDPDPTYEGAILSVKRGRPRPCLVVSILRVTQPGTGMVWMLIALY